MTEPLPDIVPIFPLAQAILLPRARLPLNIFEPRYLQMTDDALRGQRHIGMIQPMATTAAPASLHAVGCLGRLISWEESGDGRFHILLLGVSRFQIEDEIASERLYRKVRPNYAPFARDLSADDDAELDRPALFKNLQRFLRDQKLEADWDAIQEAPTEALVNSLSMICPFGPAEKQALVEAATLHDRAAVLTALIEMAAAGAGGTTLQ